MTRLTSVAIENYRGFYACREIFLALPNGARGSGLTILVGPNNSGKSTVVAAIRSATAEPKQIDLEHRHPNVSLSITLRNDLRQWKTLTNPDLGATTIYQGSADAYPKGSDIRIVPSRRAWNAYSGSQRMDVFNYWEYAKQATTQDDYLVSRIAALSSDDRVSYDALLKELLPEIKKWRIELSRGQTFVLYETRSGVSHAADLFGDGMASLFRIALALLDSSGGQITVIDEPELSLHPQAQKLLASLLSRFADNRQIIITSHSPYFLNWADIVAGAKVYRLSQSDDGVIVGHLAADTVADIERLIEDWQKPNLLDAVSREVFFADEVLFLEGQEDVGLLRKFALEKGMRALPAFGYGAGGAGNIPLFLRMARDLKIPAAAIFDGDHAEEKEGAEKQFPECLIELLAAPDIRDKPKRNEKNKEIDEIEKEGIFDRRGKIKEEHEQKFLTMLQRISGFFERGGKKRPVLNFAIKKNV